MDNVRKSNFNLKEVRKGADHRRLFQNLEKGLNLDIRGNTRFDPTENSESA